MCYEVNTVGSWVCIQSRSVGRVDTRASESMFQCIYFAVLFMYNEKKIKEGPPTGSPVVEESVRERSPCRCRLDILLDTKNKCLRMKELKKNFEKNDICNRHHKYCSES